MALFKGKGSQSTISSYRDIFLGDYDGKGFTKIIRKTLLPMASSIVGYTQFGSGFNGGETAIAHLVLRLHFDVCKMYQTPGSSLFLDVVSAFASLLRRIVFDNEQGDEAWYKELKNNGYTDADISDIHAVISQVYKQFNEGTPINKIFLTYVGAMYSNTWFSTEFLGGVVQTTQGSMAGMTFADIVYAIAFSKVLFSLNNSLVNNGVKSVYPNGTPCHFAAFCDDVIINITHSKASGLADKTAQVAAIAKQVFMFFKLQLNFKPGKSEFIMYLCGPGLKAARLAIQRQDNVVLIPDNNSVPEFLRCVRYYKHMGTAFSSAEFPAEEVVSRCAIINSSVKRFWKLFRNPHVYQNRCCQIVPYH